jgi:hypothetical protein
MITDLVAAYIAYFATGIGGALGLVAGWSVLRRLVKW